MHELVAVFPDPDILLALQPEELGAKMLFLLRKRQGPRDKSFYLGNLYQELWPGNHDGQTNFYPNQKRSEIDLAVAEAWAWLEAQGLLVPAANMNGSNGWRCLSRRARSFENETEFAKFAIARLLPRGILHSRIATTVWMAFMRSEFDVAVFQAMKTVEVAVREASSLPDGLIGVSLMRKAFEPESGPLTDKEAEKGEREACSNLFSGAIGMYKNPHSHRDVRLDDPAEAMEIIMIANHLLRIIDARKKP